VKDLSLSRLFCDRAWLWAQLRATQQVKSIQPDWLLCQPQPFCDRAWLLMQQATRQAKAMQPFRLVMPSFDLSCARDVLPVKALLQATRLGWATELAQRKRWQVRLQRRE
jgi:hypothetical protein